jgi:competence protein ComEC
MVVDAGMRSEYLDEGERTVAPFLRSNHETTIDVLMLTHPDADHMGGAKYLLEHFRVGMVVIGPGPSGGAMEDELVALCGSRGVAVQRLAKGDRFALGGAQVEVLHPPRELPADVGENDRSLVARVSWDDFSVLLTGDVERAGEEMLAGAPLRAEVMKVPHHGSITSSSEAFIDAVRPSVAVVSVGPRGRQHVLSQIVVERYESRGARVFRTDIVGGVRLRPEKGGGIRVEPARLEREYVIRNAPDGAGL